MEAEITPIDIVSATFTTGDLSAIKRGRIARIIRAITFNNHITEMSHLFKTERDKWFARITASDASWMGDTGPLGADVLSLASDATNKTNLKEWGDATGFPDHTVDSRRATSSQDPDILRMIMDNIDIVHILGDVLRQKSVTKALAETRENAATTARVMSMWDLQRTPKVSNLAVDVSGLHRQEIHVPAIRGELAGVNAQQPHVCVVFGRRYRDKSSASGPPPPPDQTIYRSARVDGANLRMFKSAWCCILDEKGVRSRLADIPIVRWDADREMLTVSFIRRCIARRKIPDVPTTSSSLGWKHYAMLTMAISTSKTLPVLHRGVTGEMVTSVPASTRVLKNKTLLQYIGTFLVLPELAMPGFGFARAETSPVREAREERKRRADIINHLRRVKSQKTRLQKAAAEGGEHGRAAQFNLDTRTKHGRLSLSFARTSRMERFRHPPPAPPAPRASPEERPQGDDAWASVVERMRMIRERRQALDACSLRGEFHHVLMDEVGIILPLPDNLEALMSGSDDDDDDDDEQSDAGGPPADVPPGILAKDAVEAEAAKRVESAERRTMMANLHLFNVSGDDSESDDDAEISDDEFAEILASASEHSGSESSGGSDPESLGGPGSESSDDSDA
jgi:hypothetical protein